MRNTIPWNLECELERNEDRYYGYKLFSISLDQDSSTKESMSMLAITAYSLIGFWTFGTFCCGGCASCAAGGQGGEVVPLFLQLCNRISIIVMASIFLSWLGDVQKITDSNIEKLAGSEDTDCSDEWSRVNVSAAESQMDESSSLA